MERRERESRFSNVSMQILFCHECVQMHTMYTLTKV